VQAKRIYVVELEWTRALTGTCTCFDHADGYFCKHQVALALAAIDAEAARGIAGGDELTVYLHDLEHEELVQLVIELVQHDPAARTRVLARAAAAGRAEALDPDELVDQVNDALRVRGFVDYRRSFDLAKSAREVLDRLVELLDVGAADAVRPALLRALTRLRKITLQADDSGGVIGDACQTAADLYARACREGHPDPVPLARWLVKFRRDSPGWPETTLADFVAAFDDRALEVYRRGVAKWAAEEPAADRYARFGVDQALLELADHDNDLEAALILLSQDPEHTHYGEIIERLVRAERPGDVLAWLDRAVGAGRLSGHAGSRGNDFWVGPARAAELYLEAGRGDDALEALRDDFRRRPGVETWRALLALGASLGSEDAQRDWAMGQLETAAQQPFGSGASLIEIHLAEERFDEAWHAADRFGAGNAWRQLAAASVTRRPVSAAGLYRPKVEALLVHADTRNYREIATLLSDMRDLYRAGKEGDVFDDYLAGIRLEYGRRPSLMKELLKKGL
jgi:hypothetical protein